MNSSIKISVGFSGYVLQASTDTLRTVSARDDP